MECPRCHNQNVKQFYTCQGETYCRQCIKFHRVFVDQKRITKRIVYPRQWISYQLDFELSMQQQLISKQLLENYQKHLNSLVWAVCGSGKTEVVFELIHYVLSKGERLCFCIPRRELVVELYERLKLAFQGIEIGVVYGGCCQHPDAQFVVCTMHQLYRYEGQYGFDLMIADEVDAFPFYQDEVLNQLFQRCCLGNFVKLSATFSSEDIHDEQVLIMNRRYHGVDLPIPRMMIGPKMLHLWILLFLLKRQRKKFLVYVPTIELTEYLWMYLTKCHLSVRKVSSKQNNNQDVIQMLKDDQIQIIVTTTLLERGITIEDVQVIVYQAHHPLFDERTLIQIAGRVGRKPQHPQGLVLFIATHKTKGMISCIHTINKLNLMNV